MRMFSSRGSDAASGLDASNTDTGLIGHSYFGDRRSVLADMFYVVRNDVRAAQRYGLRALTLKNQTYWLRHKGCCGRQPMTIGIGGPLLHPAKEVAGPRHPLHGRAHRTPPLCPLIDVKERPEKPVKGRLAGIAADRGAQVDIRRQALPHVTLSNRMLQSLRV